MLEKLAPRRSLATWKPIRARLSGCRMIRSSDKNKNKNRNRNRDKNRNKSRNRNKNRDKNKRSRRSRRIAVKSQDRHHTHSLSQVCTPSTQSEELGVRTVYSVRSARPWLLCCTDAARTRCPATPPAAVLSNCQTDSWFQYIYSVEEKEVVVVEEEVEGRRRRRRSRWRNGDQCKR